jgi:hypothetical protein
MSVAGPSHDANRFPVGGSAAAEWTNDAASAGAM